MRYYFLHKASFDGAVKLIGNNTVLDKVEKYNKIMQTAPARHYDLYIGLYVNGYTQEAYPLRYKQIFLVVLYHERMGFVNRPVFENPRALLRRIEFFQIKNDVQCA